jgi:hypothetical protein
VNTPIACQLGVFSADEQRRYQAARAEIDAAVTRMVEADNGYVFHLPRRRRNARPGGGVDRAGATLLPIL